MSVDADPVEFRAALHAWYRRVARVMPWRESDDPYRIWLSEIMLQQTRVDQARPFFERFVTAFPSVAALAGAPQAEVLRLWEGLGYYSRARNLHTAAQVIVEQYNGRVPDSYDALIALPGVGPYTAAAVVSIAFGRPHAAVDGNVIRLISRLVALRDDVGASQTKTRLQQLATRLLDPIHPGDFNQGMMELGATVCTPRAPRCTDCPVSAWCAAFAAGTQENFPVKTKKAPTPHFHHVVGLIRNAAGEYLIYQRPDDVMLGGLWTFPGGRQQPDESALDACRRVLRDEFRIAAPAAAAVHRLQHAYSHFKITLHACLCPDAIVPGLTDDQRLMWADPETLAVLAFDRASRRLIDTLIPAA